MSRPFTQALTILSMVMLFTAGQASATNIPSPECSESLEYQLDWIKTDAKIYPAFSYFIRMHKKAEVGSEEFLSILDKYNFSKIDEDRCLEQTKQMAVVDKECLADDRLLTAYLREVCKD